MQSTNKKIIVIVAAGLLFVVGLGLALFYQSNKPRSGGDTGIYVDPLSHETVSDPEGKSPDVYGQNPSSPIYLGFDKLLDHGLTLTQLNNLKSAFLKYSQKQSTPIREISVDVDHATSQYNPASGDDHYYVLFNGTFNRNIVYKAKVQYSGLSDIRLLLTDSVGNNLYDSGVIKPKSK